MEENGNFLHLSGVLTDNPVYGHEVFGEKFYYATLSVPRLSGAEDLLPITVSERLMDDTPLTIGSESADVLTLALTPSAQARLHAADALAAGRTLAYRIEGTLRAAPDDRGSARDYRIRRASELSPVPGLPGVMR